MQEIIIVQYYCFTLLPDKRRTTNKEQFPMSYTAQMHRNIFSLFKKTSKFDQQVIIFFSKNIGVITAHKSHNVGVTYYTLYCEFSTYAGKGLYGNSFKFQSLRKAHVDSFEQFHITHHIRI